MTEHTQSTSPTDGIAHGLAVAVVEAVQSLAADLSPEAVQQAAEARAVAEGHPNPSEAARAALSACLQALEAIQANSKERESGGEKDGRFSWN